MDDVTRRAMLWGASASVAATGLVQEAAARTAAFGPDDPYDLIVRGGEVLDPSQNLRGRRDIGIRNAAIVAVEPEIPAARGTQVLDATGQLVLPGLVDFPRPCPAGRRHRPVGRRAGALHRHHHL